jgi:hypothetical protein
MPATSQKQRRLMAAALHGADFPKAKAIRRSMTDEQIKDFTHLKGTPHHESHSYDFRSRNNLKRGPSHG